MAKRESRCPEGMDLLLPWYAKETLTPEDMERVRKHLEECAFCRKELERVVKEAEIIGDLESEIRVPWTLDELDVQPRGLWGRIKALVMARPGAFLVGATLQAALCLLLVGVLLYHVHGKRYVTLSSPREKAQIVVVFDGNIRERDMRRVLLEVGATIVGGPSPRGAYELGFSRPLSRQELDKILSRLKAESGVKFAARCGKS